MADVFISYASEDRERVAPLARALETQGWTVWWDRHIVAGQTFDDVIERELRSARSVVALWSASSIRSEWVRNEAAVAAERGVLVPALIDRVALPLEFRRKQTVDLVEWDGRTSHEGFQALCRGIAAAAPGPMSPPREVTNGGGKRTLPARRFVAAGAAAAIVLTAVVYWGWLREPAPSPAQPVAANTSLPRAEDPPESPSRVSSPAPPAADQPAVSVTIDSESVRLRWTGTSVWLPDQATESRNELRLPVSFQVRGRSAVVRRVRVVTESAGMTTTWDGAYEADDEPVAEYAPADAEIRRHRKPLRPFELTEQSSFATKIIDFVAVNPDPLGTGTYAVLLQVQAGSPGWSTVEKASFTVPADFVLTGRKSGVEFHRYDRWQIFPLMAAP